MTGNRRAEAACMPLLLLVCCCAAAVLAAGQKEEPLIGWKGESYRPREVPEFASGSGVRRKAEANDGPSLVRPPNPQLEGATQTPIRGEVLSWEPRVFYYPNFLSDAECKHIRKSAVPQMKRSVVYDAKGKLVVDEIRTSYGTFLRRLQDETIRNITERVAKLVQVPVVYQEDFQVLRYGKSQYYNAHFDTSKEHFSSHRAITILLYLSDVEEGGETSFPLTNWSNPEWEARNGPFSECAKGHVSVKPHKGDAAVFYSLKPEGDVDEISKHAGCPVLKGTKWTATIWVHTAPWRVENFHVPSTSEKPYDPGYCADAHLNCEKWESAGECLKNPDYMIGNGDTIGACRKACRVCRVCREDDKQCYRDNRQQAGYLNLDEDEESMMM